MAVLETLLILLVYFAVILCIFALCGGDDREELLATLVIAPFVFLGLVLVPLGYPVYLILRVAASLVSICLILVVFSCILVYLLVCQSIANLVWSFSSLKNYAPLALRVPRYRARHGVSSIAVPQAISRAEREPLLPTSDATQRCLIGCQRELEGRLCEVCDSMIDTSSLLIGTCWMWTRLVEEHPHHSSIENLWHSSTHCALCQLLVRSLPRKYSRARYHVVDNPILPSYVVKVRELAEPRVGSSLKMQLVVDGTEMPSLVVSQNIGLQHVCDVDPWTASRATIDWARDQIIICQQSHTQCRIPLAASIDGIQSSRFIPRRLIDVGRENDPTVRLISTSDLALDSPEYLALSYCWGGLAGIRLCKSNLEMLVQPSRIDVWDKTYRDAIVITRMLGVRYLWVDALCIMQPEDGDDGAGLVDWNKQAPEMGQIYAHAACVLSAIAAKSTSEGCIFPKMTLGGGCHLRQDEDSSLDVNPARSKDTIIADLFREKVDKARLSTRGWAFQERVLATRLLHFCDGVVLFECNEMQASSSHQMSQPYSHRQWLQNSESILGRASDRLDPLANVIFIPWPKLIKFDDFLWDYYRETAGLLGNFEDTSHQKDWATFDASRWNVTARQPKTEEETRAGLRAAFNTLLLSKVSSSDNSLLCHFCWFDLVGEYSVRHLTKPTDKIMAIAGLAQYLPYRFKAGILFDRFHKLTAMTLLWVRSDSQQELETGSIPPRPKRPLPTWSWASVDGRISHKLMLPSPSWKLHNQDIVFSIDYMENDPGKLLLKLRYPVFNFDESRVHFIPDIQLEPGSLQNLRCVPILYYEASDKKKQEIILHGIVVREVNLPVVEVTTEMGAERETQKEPTRELERVGNFCWTIEDASWKPIHGRDWMSLPTLIII